MITGVIGAGVSPLASDGLNEALGLPIGLRSIRSGEEVTETELVTSSGEELGAISGAAIGEDALDRDPMSGIERDGLVESGEHTRGLFVWEERGEGETGMIIDRDMEALDAGPWVAEGAVAGGAHSRTREAAQLLDVQVEELAGVVAFVADDGRLNWFERREAVEPVAT